MNSKSFVLGTLWVCVIAFCGCGTGTGRPRDTDSGSTNTNPDGSAQDAGTDGSSTGEACDGLDNDGDQAVDEGCLCTSGQTQECFPRAYPPPPGCEWGEQLCAEATWGACSGARVPAPGEEDCCVVPENPTHPLYETFLTAYPPANMPKTGPDVTSFAPVADGHVMQWSQINPGNELIDDTNGGVIEANIETGRAMARAAAEEAIPPTGVIVDVYEDPVIIEAVFGGNGGPLNSVGWGWGSLLYQTEDRSIGELVYLYIGYCNEENDGDVEGFYYSQEPLVICSAPVVE